MNTYESVTLDVMVQLSKRLTEHTRNNFEVADNAKN